jgi:hypothetical protein
MICTPRKASEVASYVAILAQIRWILEKINGIVLLSIVIHY